MQWQQVGILAGRALREGQCTLEGEAQYVNVQSSVHWEGVTEWRSAHWECKIFLIINIDQSEVIKSHKFNMSLRLTNQK